MTRAYAQKFKGSESKPPYVKGELGFTDQAIQFNDWKVKYQNVDYAIHRKEFLLWGYKHSLGVRSGSTQYWVYFKGDDAFLKEPPVEIDVELDRKLLVNSMFWGPIVIGLSLSVLQALF